MTTLLIRHFTAADDCQFCSLEHDERWYHNIIRKLQHYLEGRSSVFWTPLRAYDDFCWYDIESAELPHQIGLVVCDGPPWYSGGSRYGALPILRPRLSEKSTILLDDLHRESERALLDRWQREYGISYTNGGGGAPFAVVRLDGT